jgi:hypothetical protein
MVLIVPEAQTDFSPVEQPRLNPNAPNIGDALADLGQLGVTVAARRRQAADDRAVREARITAIEELDRVRLTFETDTNLDGLTDRWRAESAAVTERIAAGLPAHLRADFQTGLREAVAPQTVAIQRREYALWRDQETAALSASRRRLATAAASAPDDASRNALYGEWAAMVGQAEATGVLSASDAEAMRADLPRETEEIEAMRLIAEDPEAWIAGRAAGELGGSLDPKQAATFDLAARAEFGRRAAEDQRRAATAARVQDEALRARADDAIRIIGAGLRYDGLPQLMADLQGTPHYDRLQAELDGYDMAANFALMPPSAQDAELARLRDTATQDPSEVGRRNRLADLARTTRESLDADAIAHVRTRGIAEVAPMTAADLADPAKVAARRALAEAVHREYRPDATDLRYLENGEAEAIAAEMKRDPDRAMAIVVSVNDTWGAAAPHVLAEIGASDPVLHLAAALPGETGSFEATQAIFRGMAMDGSKTLPAVSKKNRDAVRAELAPAFADPVALDLALKAAEVHFRATAGGIADPEGDDARTAFRASVQAVTGATTRGGAQTGGVQTVNGRPTLLPAGLDAARVELALEADAFGRDAWTRGSVTGNLPLTGGSTTLLDDPRARRGDLTLTALSDGSYLVGAIFADGAVRYLRDAATPDGFFRLDLRRFVTGVSHP